jgi:hypothetical protein
VARVRTVLCFAEFLPSQNGESVWSTSSHVPLSPYRSPCQSCFRTSENEVQTELRISFVPARVGRVSLIAFPVVSQARVPYS